MLQKDGVHLNVMNYYDLLGVSSDADNASIRRAFRCHAKRLHPDVSRTRHAKRDFQRMNEAYQVLSDEKKRRLYDIRQAGGTYGGRVYYRPASTNDSHRRNPNQAYTYKGAAEKHVPSRFEKLFDQFLFLFMLMSGLGALFFGIYRAVGEPVEGVNPYLAISFGVIFTALFLYGWDQKQRMES